MEPFRQSACIFFVCINIDKVKLSASSEFITSSSFIISKTVNAKFNNNTEITWTSYLWWPSFELHVLHMFVSKLLFLFSSMIRDDSENITFLNGRKTSDLLFGEVHRHSQSHTFFCLFNLELAQNWKCQCYIKIFFLFLNPLNVLFISKFRSCSLCLVPCGSTAFSHKTQLFLVTLSYLFYVLQVETKMSYKRSKHVWTKDFSACFFLAMFFISI